MNTPDVRVQARAIALHACDLPPEQLATLEDLRGQLAGGLRGKSPEWAQAYQDSILATAAGDGLFPEQSEALVAPLLRLIQGELLADGSHASTATVRALQAVP